MTPERRGIDPPDPAHTQVHGLVARVVVGIRRGGSCSSLKGVHSDSRPRWMAHSTVRVGAQELLDVDHQSDQPRASPFRPRSRHPALMLTACSGGSGQHQVKPVRHVPDSHEPPPRQPERRSDPPPAPSRSRFGTSWTSTNLKALGSYGSPWRRRTSPTARGETMTEFPQLRRCARSGGLANITSADIYGETPNAKR